MKLFSDTGALRGSGMGTGRVSRRDTLRGFSQSLAGAAFGAGLWEVLLQGMASPLQAATDSKRYLHFQMPGAPARWVYDLFLTPYSTEGFQSNAMVGTCLKEEGGRYTQTDYQTVKIHGVNVPYFWSVPVPSAGGGLRDPGELLKNLLSLQGITTANAGHPGSQSLHQRPLGALQSLPALVADVASTPIPALSVGTRGYQFRSLKGKNPVLVPQGKDQLLALLNPFRLNLPESYRTKRQAILNSLNEVVAKLDKAAVHGNPLLQNLVDNHRGAKDLLEAGFEGAETEWKQLTGKYRDLVRRALSQDQKIERINDLPIGSADPSSRGLAYQLNGTILKNRDLRNLLDEQVQINSLVFQFSMAEYVLQKDLSRSLSLRLMPMDSRSFRSNFDEHKTGALPSFLTNFYYARALTACQLELTDALKRFGIWDKTLINVSGEFNRTPKVDQTGSDHGWQGASIALYSGQIRSPLILGAFRNDPRPKYRGTWGQGASDPNLGRQLGLADFGSTLATLLDVPSPISAAGSVLIRERGGWKPLISKTKILG